MLKKVLSAVLAFILACSLFGCGEGQSENQTETETTVEDLYTEEQLNNCDAVEIAIDGTPLSEFTGDKTQYWHSVKRLRQPPEITVTPAEKDATVNVEATRQKAVITVTSSNGQKERTYTVDFIDIATYNKYNLDLYTLPFWKGNIVYNETLMFVGETEAPLLYYPDKVLSVRSYDLAYEYEEGVDYEVRDGKIVLLEGTKIPSFTLEEFYPASPELSLAQTQLCNVAGHRYILFSEGSFFFKRQIHVTYAHTEEWNGAIPEKSEKLHSFIERAEAGEELNLVFFGDSITTGGNASGKTNCPPYTDIWPVMVKNVIANKFPQAQINYINTAVGGKETNWAIENLKESVIDKNPDMVILGFGMNDGSKLPSEYETNTRKLVEEILRAHPDCEIVLLATMLPHFRLTNFHKNQSLFEDRLYKIAREYDNVDVVPMTSIHTSILEHKRYYDMTGNNVNHPSDFLVRIYAQSILEVILGTDE